MPYSGAALRSTKLYQELRKQFDVTVIAAQEPADRRVLPTVSDENLTRVPFFTPSNKNNSVFRRLLNTKAPGFSAIETTILRDAIRREWIENGPYDTIYFVSQLTASVLPIKGMKYRAAIDVYDYYATIHAARRQQISIFRPYYWIYLKDGILSRRLEHRVLRQASLIFVPTVDELSALSRTISGIPIHVLPNGASTPVKRWSNGDNLSVLMVANFDYGPNREGLQWFLEHAWHEVLKVQPSAVLRIVGKGSSNLRLGDVSGVMQIGQVDDLSCQYLNAACCIIPVLSGGGSRLKLLEAMAYGIPTVSTTFGASGIQHENTIFLADTPLAFAAAVSSCLQGNDMTLYRAARSSEVIANSYTWEKIGIQLRSLLS